MAIKQFVPSHVCLKCEGCCRFNLDQSPWRPKLGDIEGLAAQAQKDGYLDTVAVGEKHHCKYFNHADFTCGVYDQRPFECALYPFILSYEDNVIKCYVHLACPFVQDNLNNDLYKRYSAYLRDYVSTGTFQLWLKENTRLLHDYRHAKDELMHLFDLSFTL